MTGVSPRTAELALDALVITWRTAAPRRNGLPVPEDWRVAFAELEDATRSPERPDSAPVGMVARRLTEEVDVVEAARRLGLTRRAVQKRCASGRLPARRIGRSWLISWTTTEEAA